MPKTRTNAKRDVEQVRFTKGQLRAIDGLVKSELYGTCRPDVIRFFVMQGIAEYDKQGRFTRGRK